MATSRIPGEIPPEPLSGATEAAFATGRDAGVEALEALGVHDVHRHRDIPRLARDDTLVGEDMDIQRSNSDRLSLEREDTLIGEKAMMKMSKADISDEINRVQSDEESMHIGKGMTASEKVSNMQEIALHALHVDDDRTLNPWTFRTWFLGLGLSCFSATLATIYEFKPQGISLTATFLGVVSYVLALALEYIPRKGRLGRFLNPHPFNSKEHAAILIMSSTAAHSARAIEVIAVQKLWYNKIPNAAICIFLIFSSQTLGYGIAGLMRKILVYPTKFVFPVNLPIMSLLETLHRSKRDTKPQLRIFYWAFALIFVWEVFPQYIMPLLTAVSVFCLANRSSMVFTTIFGGGNGNEGLGVGALTFDFLYIGSDALYLPPLTIFNCFIGYILNIVLFLGLFYGNVWRARDFPFLSQLLFSPESNSTHYVTFNQSSVLDEHGVVDETLLMKEGVPHLAATFASYVLTQNLAITATITHLILYNWDDLKSAWSFMAPSNLKILLKPETYMFWKKWNEPEPTPEELAAMDPHYRLMRHYADVPSWWYASVFLIATIVGLICISLAESGMAWWAFFVALGLSAIMILFTGAQVGLTGFKVPVQPLIQMIGAYLEPGRPLTNMYFTLFGYNSVVQGLLLLQDLKLGQYAKLSPRCTFTMQMVGTLVGSLLNYIIMTTITDNQREILLSIEGTHIWSGASLQSFNTQAITWGGLAKHMYSWGSTYQWVPLGLIIGFAAPLPLYFLHRRFPKWGVDRLNVSIISWHIGWMVTGINSMFISYFAVAWISGYYLRRWKPEWFLKFNYVLCAGLDGGTQVIVFIMTFALFGASGSPVPFPSYWGNNAENGNIDYCMTDPAA